MARLGKPVLLVGKDENALGLLRFILLCYPTRYKAKSVNTVQEALDALKVKKYAVTIYLLPVKDVDVILERARSIDDHMRTIVVAKKFASFPAADAVMFKPSTAELLERLRLFCVRKRGPHRFQCPVPMELFELGVS